MVVVISEGDMTEERNKEAFKGNNNVHFSKVSGRLMSVIFIS